MARVAAVAGGRDGELVAVQQGDAAGVAGVVLSAAHASKRVALARHVDDDVVRLVCVAEGVVLVVDGAQILGGRDGARGVVVVAHGG